MGIYIPHAKTFVIGDNFYKTFPNLYAIRGTPPRPVEEWFESIDKVSHNRFFFIDHANTIYFLSI